MSRSWRVWPCVWTCAPPGSLHLCILYCSWCICRACLCCVDVDGTGNKMVIEKESFAVQWFSEVLCSVLLKPYTWHALFEKGTKFFHTCKFESCVKDFSQPGWVHLYGRSPVWILSENTNTYMYRKQSFHDDLTWPQKDTEADEKPKPGDSLTCCAAEGDWAVWSTFGSRSRRRVSLLCGCGHVGPGS